MFEEQIVNEILTIPLRTDALEDKLAWMEIKSGGFSVKSAYNIGR